MTAAGIGCTFALARFDQADRLEGPIIYGATLNRVEAEVRHHVPDEEHRALRLRLVRLHPGDELAIEDPRACGGRWAVKRTG